MLAKLYTLALAASLVSAITFNSVPNTSNGGQLTVTWSAATSDPPYMSLEMYNPAFNDYYAVANNVPVAPGQITFAMPEVPNSNYLLVAVATNDINNVLSTSAPFSVVPSSSVSGTASSASAASSFSLSSLSITSTSTGSSTSSTQTATTPISSVSSLPSSSSSSSASATPTAFTSGAGSFKLVGVAPAAALVLSAVAGAALVF